MFLVRFVALQVVTKGAWWVSFGDGAQSLLLNENSFGALWITLLQGDWHEDFCTTKGWSYEEHIWCMQRKIEGAFWWWRKAKWLDFWKTRSVCRILILGVVRMQKDKTSFRQLDYKTLTLEIPLRQELGEGLEVWYVFLEGPTQGRKRLCQGFLEWLCGSSCDNFGDLEMMSEQSISSWG